MTRAFDWTGGRGRFTNVLFKRAFTPVSRPAETDAGIVTAYTDGQVTLRSNRDKIGYHEAADTSTYKAVLPGDFVVHGLDILRGSVGVSDSAGAISPVCTVCLPRPGVDGRFVAYAMRAQAAAGVPRALARGVREGGADFRRWETLGELPIPLPPLEEQERIANFLDEQVALLDESIKLQQEETSLLEERFDALLEWTLWDASPANGLMRLGYAVERVTSGPRGWGDFVGTEGRPFFRSANLRRESLAPKLDELARVLVPERFDKEAARASVHRGDLLVGITGANAGWVTHVQDDALEGAVVSQHVALVRPAACQLNSAWLGHILRSHGCGAQLAAMQYGGTKTQLSLPNLRDLRIPSRSLDQQIAETRTLDEQAEALGAYRSLAMQHVSLLQERKQALITAAVLGEFDATTARSAA